MHTHKDLQQEIKNAPLNLLKTITATLDNGGAVTFQIEDACDFILCNKYPNEQEFLLHLTQRNSLTQEALECFLRHMLFNKNTASLFVRWQREKHSSIT